MFDGVPPDSNPMSRPRTFYDEFLDDAMDGLTQAPLGLDFHKS